jgi:predicted TIM-barrel fold metal-dependent hydrolase
MHLVNYDNLRDFYIEFQDRLLYATDGGRIADSGVAYYTRGYANTFAFLETDQMVEGDFFGKTPKKGLNLPREVLEKIYYKNALKLYPGLKEAMRKIPGLLP